jgi:hypothetical protein
LACYRSDELDSNRQLFLDALKPKDKGCILDTWKSKEHRVVWYYTKLYPNLRPTSRQCGESYHPVMGKLTNGRLTIEQSVKRLVKKVLSIRKGTSVNEDMSLRKYPRATQLRSVTFQCLRGQSSKVIELLEKEWQKLLRATVTDDDLGEYMISPILRFYTANRRLRECRCSALRYGISCKHYLQRVYTENLPIPKSFLHPR